jgi:hypothetical protein
VPIVPWRHRGCGCPTCLPGTACTPGTGCAGPATCGPAAAVELHRYAHVNRSANDVLEIWQALRRPQFDYSVAQIAQALNMTPRALAQALHRARSHGDPRAVPARDTRFKPAPRRRSPQPDVGPGFDPDTRDEGEESA